MGRSVDYGVEADNESDHSHAGTNTGGVKSYDWYQQVSIKEAKEGDG